MLALGIQLGLGLGDIGLPSGKESRGKRLGLGLQIGLPITARVTVMLKNLGWPSLKTRS